MAALPASHATLATTPVDTSVDPDSSTYAAHLTEHLRRIVSDPFVREAIEVSSDSLARTVDKIENGEKVKRSKLIRAALAATRYLLRMTGRPTPFGLLAGVQHATFGEQSSVRVGTSHHKLAKVDAAWLDAVLREHRHEASVQAATSVVANNLCTVRGDRLVLPYVRATDGQSIEELSHELSVGYTAVVRVALQAARKPIPLPALRRELRQTYPTASERDIDALLGRLIDYEILLTDLGSRQDQPDQLAYVTQRLPADTSTTGADLARIAATVHDYAATEPGQGRHAWRRAVTTIREVHGCDRPPIQVDMRMDAEVHLPAAVAEEAARAGEALWRLSPESKFSLRDYHNRFLDRYGTDELVPVAELLDPHRGLGAPAGYQVPPSEEPANSTGRESFSAERDQALAEAVQSSIERGELELDDALLERLAHDEQRPPESMDIGVQPLARSTTALDNGEFRLVIASIGHTAGSLSGRFRHVLGEQAPVRPPDTHPDNNDSPLRAQLYFQPLHPRPSNISRVRRLAPQALAIGCFPDDTDALGPEDIGVGATSDGLYLAHLTTGRQVLIDRPHLLNLVTEAPNMVRLLAAASTHTARECVPWRWGRLNSLAYLPRVRYGRSILATARWRVASSLCDPDLSFREWREKLESWRRKFDVPERTKIQEKDYFLDIDLNEPLHQELLRTKLRGHTPALLYESPGADESELGWSNGHATEIVVPLRATEPRLPAVSAVPRDGDRIAHAPGGEWIYAKIYAVRDRHEGILAGNVSELIRQVSARIDRWFFVRYADPQPHLRIRLHAPQHEDRAAVCTALHRWAQQAMDDGVIRKLVLDTYEPEQTRYGGRTALAAAEQLFYADSATVVQQFRMRAREQLNGSAELLAAINCADMLAGLGGWDWCQWVVDNFPSAAQHELTAAARRQALALLDPADRWRTVADLGGSEHLAPVWTDRVRAANEYGALLGIDAPGTGSAGASVPTDKGPLLSIMHMHVNRLLGPDRRAERRVYALLRTAVSGHLARQRQGT